ncbi:MAG: prepilin-type N-terminal cleavage/methylation domain-containing protein [Planctomycetes bacterium]|nr:prepilin-type N-terminal cleavage/methylation domain-containing protein [Planctomycetota bacterium]
MPAARTVRLPRRAAFTLLELLVVMGILLVLAVLTAFSVGKVTSDAKLANATNTLVAMLGNARAIAIRDNAYVMVTFRVAPDRRARAVPRDPPAVQVVTARWTGEVVTVNTPLPNPNPPVPGGVVAEPIADDVFADRFVPVPGVPTRELPGGIMVGGPAFGFVTDASVGRNDRWWRTLPRFAGTLNLAAIPPTFAPNLARTELGWGIGVLFGPDGRVLSRNPQQVLEVVTSAGGNQNAYVKSFVDFDGNGFPNRGSTNVFGSGPNNVDFFIYDEPLDEPLVDYVPYLAVFNEAEARKLYNASTWQGTGAGAIGNNGNPSLRVRDQSSFIDEQSDRITFNRYTGVPGVVPK